MNVKPYRVEIFSSYTLNLMRCVEFETEKEAINYATSRKDDAENVRVIKEGSKDPILTFHDGEKKYEQDSHAAD